MFPQNSIASFKELCGLSAVANLKQCILALSTRLTGADNNPLVLFNLNEQYPIMEAQGLLPEVLKKVSTAYELVRIMHLKIQNHTFLITHSHYTQSILDIYTYSSLRFNTENFTQIIIKPSPLIMQQA